MRRHARARDAHDRAEFYTVLRHAKSGIILPDKCGNAHVS
jgi:hypothetical protein